MSKQKKSFVMLVIGIVLLLCLDQGTKYLAVTYLKGQKDIDLISNFFVLHYLENTGAAWGMLAGKKGILILISIAAFLVFGYFYLKIPDQKKYSLLKVIFMLIMSGAVGNLIDRGIRGYVIDFLYAKWIEFPVFNVADIYVTIGAAILVISIFTIYRKEEFNFWFGNKEKK